VLAEVAESADATDLKSV